MINIITVYSCDHSNETHTHKEYKFLNTGNLSLYKNMSSEFQTNIKSRYAKSPDELSIDNNSIVMNKKMKLNCYPPQFT
jgi:hypothetical protein